MVFEGEMEYNCSIETANGRKVSLAPAPVLTTRKGYFPMATPKHTQLPLPLPDAVVEIPLTRGYVAIVDYEDRDLAQFKWNASVDGHTVYARRKLTRKNGKCLYLHQVILARMLGRELLSGEYPDHIDGNGLLNVRTNLRLATIAENAHNQRRNSFNTSGFKGVSRNKQMQKWQAYIKYKGRKIHLGLFDTAEAAHAAYCEKAKELFGEFARFE